MSKPALAFVARIRGSDARNQLLGMIVACGQAARDVAPLMAGNAFNLLDAPVRNSVPQGTLHGDTPAAE